MYILCYGMSPERQKECCEFFQGAGCCSEWAIDFEAALSLLSSKPFDAVVFGAGISASECETLAQAMRSIRPRLEFFSLAAMERERSGLGAASIRSSDRWPYLLSAYLGMQSSVPRRSA
jgi:hypothetical protein